MPPKLRAIQADITTPRVDAIVNAANSSLLGGGGVDGYPVELAAAVAVETVWHSLAESDAVEAIDFGCYSAADLAVYENILRGFADQF